MCDDIVAWLQGYYIVLYSVNRMFTVSEWHKADKPKSIKIK